MRLALFGATSQIAKDLIVSFSVESDHELVLYARRPEAVSAWLCSAGLLGKYEVDGFAAFRTSNHFDAILNFVGVGDPARTAEMGSSIFDVTLQYDDLATAYLHQHPTCRYLFMSSGAAYGASFSEPVNDQTKASIPINNLQPQDWYTVAKLHAECRHRLLPHLAIIDIRVFNYFSHTQDLDARFLITDILRAIRSESVLKTSAEYMMRDYLHPSDFYQLIVKLLDTSMNNGAVDCYSLEPIDKLSLLETMRNNFGLLYEFVNSPSGVTATGSKPYYYSLNRRAANFGYQPKLSSREGILQESIKILASQSNE